MIDTPSFWLCLAGSLIVYWLLPRRWRLGFLAIVSVGYLAWDGPAGARVSPPVHAAILCALAGLCYWLAPLTRTPRQTAGAAPAPAWSPFTRTVVFWGLIALALAYLLTTKYGLARHVHGDPVGYAVPLGVSYLVFKLIHVTVEFARGSIKDRSIGSYVSSLFVFPTLAAGPIERYDHFLAHEHADFRPDDLLQGVTRIIVGLVKRFVIADQFFGAAWHYVNEGNLAGALDHVTPMTVWKLALFCVLYMYLDFSAYSDIAIGCCRLFGLRIMENFDWPLIAPNLPAFWRRWHMTLTGWCQNYIFMPTLGRFRSPTLATLATFVVIGLWHGSSGATWPWALWGVYHGLGMVGHQQWARQKRQRKWAWCDRWWWYAAGVAITLAFVSVGDLVALFGPTGPRQIGTLFLRLAFVGGGRHA